MAFESISKFFKVSFHSKPSPASEFYSGELKVEADDEENAIECVLNQLKSGSFSDRPKSSWVIDEVKEI